VLPANKVKAQAASYLEHKGDVYSVYQGNL